MKRGLEALWEGAVGEGTVLVLQGVSLWQVPFILQPESFSGTQGIGLDTVWS